MIEFRNVTKDYGKTIALSDITLNIEHSGIYCLLGRNGAGKTTLLKSMAGHFNVNDGAIYVSGSKVSTINMPKQVHFTESSASQFNMKLRDLLNSASDINPLFDKDLAFHLADKFKLDLAKRFRQMSFGMKAMVNAVIALASSKNVVLLDEPVLGFDPIMRRNFYQLLQESCLRKPKIVIVSTHIIDEISRVAEKIIIIEQGRLLLYCDIDDINENAYCVTGLREAVLAATKGLNVIGQTVAGGFISQYVYDKRIANSDKYQISTLGLQDFFVGLVGDKKEESI